MMVDQRVEYLAEDEYEEEDREEELYTNLG